MQPLHGMIDISITLVQIASDLRALDCEAGHASEKNTSGQDVPPYKTP